MTLQRRDFLLIVTLEHFAKKVELGIPNALLIVILSCRLGTGASELIDRTHTESHPTMSAEDIEAPIENLLRSVKPFGMRFLERLPVVAGETVPVPRRLRPSS